MAEPEDPLLLKPWQVIVGVLAVVALGGLAAIYINVILGIAFVVVWLAVLPYAAG